MDTPQGLQASCHRVSDAAIQVSNAGYLDSYRLIDDWFGTQVTVIVEGDTRHMSIYKCLVNRSIDAPTRCRVAEELERLTNAHIDLADQAIDVEFVEVAKGAWFTGGVPSTASRPGAN